MPLRHNLCRTSVEEKQKIPTTALRPEASSGDGRGGIVLMKLEIAIPMVIGTGWFAQINASL